MTGADASGGVRQADVFVDPMAPVDNDRAEQRAACLAEVSAETAEWIACDLETRAGGGLRDAAERIRGQAAGYRAAARRHWARTDAV